MSKNLARLSYIMDLDTDPNMNPNMNPDMDLDRMDSGRIRANWREKSETTALQYGPSILSPAIYDQQYSNG
jgi:hypothetical protein